MARRARLSRGIATWATWMLRSFYLSLVYGVFVFAGVVAPFAFGLGYVWVDNFTPQKVAYSILTELPVSQIMAVGCVGAYVLVDRRAKAECGFGTWAIDAGVDNLHDVCVGCRA